MLILLMRLHCKIMSHFILATYHLLRCHFYFIWIKKSQLFLFYLNQKVSPIFILSETKSLSLIGFCIIFYNFGAPQWIFSLRWPTDQQTTPVLVVLSDLKIMTDWYDVTVLVLDILRILKSSNQRNNFF